MNSRRLSSSLQCGGNGVSRRRRRETAAHLQSCARGARTWRTWRIWRIWRIWRGLASHPTWSPGGQALGTQRVPGRAGGKGLKGGVFAGPDPKDRVPSQEREPRSGGGGGVGGWSGVRGGGVGTVRALGLEGGSAQDLDGLGGSAGNSCEQHGKQSPWRPLPAWGGEG